MKKIVILVAICLQMFLCVVAENPAHATEEYKKRKAQIIKEIWKEWRDEKNSFFNVARANNISVPEAIKLVHGDVIQQAEAQLKFEDRYLPAEQTNPSQPTKENEGSFQERHDGQKFIKIKPRGNGNLRLLISWIQAKFN